MRAAAGVFLGGQAKSLSCDRRACRRSAGCNFGFVFPMIVRCTHQPWQEVEARNHCVDLAKPHSVAAPVRHDDAWLRAFRRRLLSWYVRHARDLPWRRTRAPYHVWLSEIMLQQTQVATVIPYFERFTQALPTIAALAAAPESQVLRLWEGLGYYRRARQLHRAAQVIVERHGGVFPRELAQILDLPGVGRYTAGAIASIAFDVAAPILEANTVRLFSRLSRFADDPKTSAGQQFLWNVAETLLPRRGAGQLNQALMELGSQICLPRAPLCGECPVSQLCPTRAAGLQDAIPRPHRKPVATEVRQLLIVVRRGAKLLLRRANDGERWAGLWDFPRFEFSNAHDVANQEAAISEELGLRIALGERLTTLRHTVTRFRITLDCFSARLASPKPTHDARNEQCWFTLDELADLPLNVTGRKVHKLLTQRVASPTSSK